MYYEVKIKTLEVDEIGKEKCVTRTFLIDSMSFTEAEARIIEHAKVYAGDYEVISIARSKVNEVIKSDTDSDEMKFFNVTVAYSTETDSGKRKNCKCYYLVESQNPDGAISIIQEEWRESVLDWDIIMVKESPIREVLEYKE